MSYPVEEYKPRTELVDRKENDVMRSFFGLANRMMGEMLNDRSGGFSSFSSSGPSTKVFGMSSMNVTQISRGPDGRPRVVQAHDERRMGPNGVWQTKKALRDPDRGIDRMQIGYFVGDQGEIIERQRDPASGQYRQEIKRRNLPSNQQNFSNQWRSSAQQAMQRPPPPLQNQPALPPYEPYPEQQSIAYNQEPYAYNQQNFPDQWRSPAQQRPLQNPPALPSYEPYPEQQSIAYNQDPYAYNQYY